MENQKLTPYEKRRLQNIRRNDEMMAALKIQAAASRLAAATKRPRVPRQIKPKNNDSPIAIRRSSRMRGVPPQIRMSDVYSGNGSYQPLIDTLLSLQGKSLVGRTGIGVLVEDNAKPQVGVSASTEFDGYEKEKGDRISKGFVELWSTMNLKQENVANVLPGRIMEVKFLPCNNVRMIVAGNEFGSIAFWNVDSQEDYGDGKYSYQQHTGPISGILFQQSCLSKIFTSCYDGYLRLMNAEKEVIDLVHFSKEAIVSLSQKPNDMSSLYFGKGHGILSVWDERTGRLSSEWNLHENRINTIDFNPQNPNIIVTSSSDKRACLWDIRMINRAKPKRLLELRHKKIVYSAYFSPSGSYLATTSDDDTIWIQSTANFNDNFRIWHENISCGARGIWGWDDSVIFTCNRQEGMDIISLSEKRVIWTLESPHMSFPPSRFDVHPFSVGMLAAATDRGQDKVYLWTSS